MTRRSTSRRSSVELEVVVVDVVVVRVVVVVASGAHDSLTEVDRAGKREIQSTSGVPGGDVDGEA